MDAIEIAAAAAGFLCVRWTVRQSALCWPAGLVQVCLYLFVFWKAKLYSDLLLHLIYVVLQIYGWHQWVRRGTRHQRLTVTAWGWKRVAVAAGCAGVVATSWGALVRAGTDAASPFADASLLVLSVVAQLLMAWKKVESWYFWVAVDVLALWVYGTRGLYPTMALYALFLLMALQGLQAWKRSLASAPNTLTPTVQAV